MAKLTESVVEDAALDWLCALRYEVLSGLAIAPGEPAAERTDYKQVFLFDRLQTKLKDLNPKISLEGLTEALRSQICRRRVEWSPSPIRPVLRRSTAEGGWTGVRCRIPRNADSFQQDLHPDLKADFVPVRKDLANPPFNMSDWGGENLRQDVRCFSLSASIGERAGVRCRIQSSPVNNANYAWIQHYIHHLSPVGVAGFVIANTTRSAHSCSMKITEVVRKYAAEQDIAEEESLKKGMEAKSKHFVKKGTEVYAKA